MVISRSLFMYRVNKGWDLQTAATVPPQGAVPFNMVVWDTGFDSLEDVAADPRCWVSLAVLKERMDQGCDLEWAANMPRANHLAAWGGCFKNLSQLANDPRCKVPYRTLGRRIAKGMSPGVAASNFSA